MIQAIARRTIDARYRSFLGDEGVDWFISSGESDRELKTHFDNLHVMTGGGEILGFSIFFEDLIHLRMVDTSRHREGLGTSLLTYVEKSLAKSRDVIRLETFEGNEQAINFYRKNGWAETRREEDAEHGFVRVFFEKPTGG